MLVGVLLITLEIRRSRRSLAFETQRVTRLTVGVAEGRPEETVGARVANVTGVPRLV